MINLLNEQMNYQKWKGNSRVSRLLFEELVELVWPFAKEQSKCVLKNIVSLEKRVALKDMGSMRMTVNTCRIARCTAGLIIHV